MATNYPKMESKYVFFGLDNNLLFDEHFDNADPRINL